MSDEFSFEEHKVSYSSESGPKGMIGFLINKCGVKTEAAANVILLVLSFIIFALAISVFVSASN